MQSANLLYENERISTVVDVNQRIEVINLYENERISTVVDIGSDNSINCFMRMKEFLLL